MHRQIDKGSFVFLIVIIFFSVFDHKQNSHHDRHYFGNRNRPPNAIDAKRKRQQQHRRNLKNKRAHKGYRRRNRSVVERREKRGAEYRKACKKEGKREYPEGVFGHRKQFGVISDKHQCQRPRKQEG